MDSEEPKIDSEEPTKPEDEDRASEDRPSSNSNDYNYQLTDSDQEKSEQPIDYANRNKHLKDARATVVGSGDTFAKNKKVDDSNWVHVKPAFEPEECGSALLGPLYLDERRAKKRKLYQEKVWKGLEKEDPAFLKPRRAIVKAKQKAPLIRQVRFKLVNKNEKLERPEAVAREDNMLEYLTDLRNDRNELERAVHKKIKGMQGKRKREEEERRQAEIDERKAHAAAY